MHPPFSFSDQLRPLLDSCFPCFRSHRSNSNPSSPSAAIQHSLDLFPDSDTRRLLDDYDGDHQQDFFLPLHHRSHPRADLISLHSHSGTRSSRHYGHDLDHGPHPTLSRWDLLLSWLSSHFSSTHPPPPWDSLDTEDPLETSALALPPSQDDAQPLGDVSFLALARPTADQPQPSRTPRAQRLSMNTHLKLIFPQPASRQSPVHSVCPPVSQGDCAARAPELAKKRTRWGVKHHRLADGSSMSATSHSDNASAAHPIKRHRSGRERRAIGRPDPAPAPPDMERSAGSASSVTDDAPASELFSNPTETSRATTARSQLGSEHAATLFRHIHRTYNAECRRLYGRDLSRSEIEQLSQHLAASRATRVRERPSPLELSYPAHSKALHVSRRSGESHERAKLLSEEFLGAIKLAKESDARPDLVRSNTQSALHEPQTFERNELSERLASTTMNDDANGSDLLIQH